MNRVVIVGNLTHSPELRTTPNGFATCSFCVAVNRSRAKEGTQKADFFNVVAWRKLAENCSQYLSKGSKVGVSGSIQIRSYEAKDGGKRYITEIVADEVEFLSAPNRQQATEAHDEEFVQVSDEELPF